MNNLLLGVVEGFFGKPWSWEAREDYAQFLSKAGFNFFLYAPKADAYLRKEWSEPFPTKHFLKLKQLGQTFQGEGLRWGVGLSPFEVYLSFDKKAKETLSEKLKSINLLNPDVLAILFDDMHGNIPDLAKLQAEIMHFIISNTKISKLLFCPTYYTFDPVLDQFFGQRPKNYLQDLGKFLDEKVHIIWTGPKVCSSEIAQDHLKKVQNILGRKPFIWDNYPVNDGPKNCHFLFIDALKARCPEIKHYISGYMSNPMNQAYLSQIPLFTIAQYLKQEKNYNPEHALSYALSEVAGDISIQKLKSYIPNFQKKGLRSLSTTEKDDIHKFFSKVNQKWANEILDWLDGNYAVGPEVLKQ